MSFNVWRNLRCVFRWRIREEWSLNGDRNEWLKTVDESWFSCSQYWREREDRWEMASPREVCPTLIFPRARNFSANEFISLRRWISLGFDWLTGWGKNISAMSNENSSQFEISLIELILRWSTCCCLMTNDCIEKMRRNSRWNMSNEIPWEKLEKVHNRRIKESSLFFSSLTKCVICVLSFVRRRRCHFSAWHRCGKPLLMWFGDISPGQLCCFFGLFLLSEHFEHSRENFFDRSWRKWVPLCIDVERSIRGSETMFLRNAETHFFSFSPRTLFLEEFSPLEWFDAIWSEWSREVFHLAIWSNETRRKSLQFVKCFSLEMNRLWNLWFCFWFAPSMLIIGRWWSDWSDSSLVNGQSWFHQWIEELCRCQCLSFGEDRCSLSFVQRISSSSLEMWTSFRSIVCRCPHCTFIPHVWSLFGFASSLSDIVFQSSRFFRWYRSTGIRGNVVHVFFRWANVSPNRTKRIEILSKQCERHSLFFHFHPTVLNRIDAREILVRPSGTMNDLSRRRCTEHSDWCLNRKWSKSIDIRDDFDQLSIDGFRVKRKNGEDPSINIDQTLDERFNSPPSSRRNQEETIMDARGGSEPEEMPMFDLPLKRDAHVDADLHINGKEMNIVDKMNISDGPEMIKDIYSKWRWNSMRHHLGCFRGRIPLFPGRIRLWLHPNRAQRALHRSIVFSLNSFPMPPWPWPSRCEPVHSGRKEGGKVTMNWVKTLWIEVERVELYLGPAKRTSGSTGDTRNTIRHEKKRLSLWDRNGRFLRFWRAGLGLLEKTRWPSCRARRVRLGTIDESTWNHFEANPHGKNWNSSSEISDVKNTGREREREKWIFHWSAVMNWEKLVSITFLLHLRQICRWKTFDDKSFVFRRDEDDGSMCDRRSTKSLTMKILGGDFLRQWKDEGEQRQCFDGRQVKHFLFLFTRWSKLFILCWEEEETLPSVIGWRERSPENVHLILRVGLDHRHLLCEMICRMSSIFGSSSTRPASALEWRGGEMSIRSSGIPRCPRRRYPCVTFPSSNRFVDKERKCHTGLFQRRRHFIGQIFSGDGISFSTRSGGIVVLNEKMFADPMECSLNCRLLVESIRRSCGRGSVFRSNRIPRGEFPIVNRKNEKIEERMWGDPSAISNCRAEWKDRVDQRDASKLEKKTRRIDIVEKISSIPSHSLQSRTEWHRRRGESDQWSQWTQRSEAIIASCPLSFRLHEGQIHEVCLGNRDEICSTMTNEWRRDEGEKRDELCRRPMVDKAKFGVDLFIDEHFLLFVTSDGHFPRNGDWTTSNGRFPVHECVFSSAEKTKRDSLEVCSLRWDCRWWNSNRIWSVKMAKRRDFFSVESLRFLHFIFHLIVRWEVFLLHFVDLIVGREILRCQV